MHVILKPTKAELTRSTDIGKMDVYLVIKQGTKTYQGKVSTVKGSKPVFEESFDLTISGDGTVQLIAMDYDSNSSDDHIADTLLNLNNLAKTGNNNAWFDFYFEGEKAGQIWIDVFIVPINQGPVLEIAPLRAQLTRDTEAVGKMDPYVKLNLNGNIFVSAIAQEGGKTPKWNDSFLVPLTGNGNGLFSVWDHDGAFSEIVGDGDFNLFVLEKAGSNVDIKLTHNGKDVGVLSLQITRYGSK